MVIRRMAQKGYRAGDRVASSLVDGIGGHLPSSIFFYKRKPFRHIVFVLEGGGEVDNGIVSIGCPAQGLGEVDPGGVSGNQRTKGISESFQRNQPLFLGDLLAKHGAGLFPAFFVFLVVQKGEPFLSGSGGLVLSRSGEGGEGGGDRGQSNQRE